ncbi:MAG: hypothetical protein HWE08_08560 [Alphaproteobacteria bacterium]|nr:hypothetical protein [Alphaproteobacteria bacterium]
MQSLSKLALMSTILSVAVAHANAADHVSINATETTGLLDGRCGNDEWDAATQIELPAQAVVYVMQDEDSFYICAAAKPEDHTVLDLYIEHPETGNLHHFHLSAQMGEAIRTDEGWSKSGTWNLKDYAGFWVPYFGLEDPESRARPKFARGTHRQMQIRRTKFPGDSWKMMVGLSAIWDEGKRVELFYPETAMDTDTATWGTFSFSK